MTDDVETLRGCIERYIEDAVTRRIALEALTRLEQEREELREACESQGLPVDVAVLVQHHRAQGGMVVAAESAAERRALQARVEELTAALEPFARAAYRADELDRPDHYDIDGITELRAKHLRTARTALPQPHTSTTCPTCGSDDPKEGYVESPHATADMPCPDPFHAQPNTSTTEESDG